LGSFIRRRPALNRSAAKAYHFGLILRAHDLDVVPDVVNRSIDLIEKAARSLKTKN
jgi:hypothetical protein